MMAEPRYKTDLKACSCLGNWYRRTCKHYQAYGEAVAMVLAQNAANVTWDTGKGVGGAKCGSQRVTDTGRRVQYWWSKGKGTPVSAEFSPMPRRTLGLFDVRGI